MVKFNIIKKVGLEIHDLFGFKLCSFIFLTF